MAVGLPSCPECAGTVRRAAADPAGGSLARGSGEQAHRAGSGRRCPTGPEGELFGPDTRHSSPKRCRLPNHLNAFPSPQRLVERTCHICTRPDALMARRCRLHSELPLTSPSRLTLSPSSTEFGSWSLITPADPQERLSGSRTTNSLPFPTPSLWAATLPPWSSTRRRTSDRPSPSPPCVESKDPLT